MSKRKNDEDISESSEKKQKIESGSAEETYPHVDGEICHVEFPVTDLKVADTFYRETFGLGVLESHPDRVIFKSKNTGCLCISIYKPEGEHPGPAHGAYFYAENIPALLEKIHNNGGLVVANSKLMGGGPVAMATFQDPDGNTIKLIQHKDGRKDVETKTVEQKIQFKLKPQVIYEVFTDSKKHQALSGIDKDVCNTAPRGMNNLYTPGMTGRTLEQPTKNKRIVMMLRSWDWPQGHYGKFTVELASKKGGTEVHVTFTDVPADKFQSIDDGLYVHYWNKLGDGEKRKVENYKPC
jgi:predicted enzyme related to lactoylglutathione lyase